MPLPQRDPDPSAIEFARERLAESWEPFAQRLDTLDGLQRSVALWLIAAEALALFEYRLEEKIDGLRLLAFGVDSFDLSDASLQITAYVMPTALDANLSRVLPQIAVRDEAGEVEYIDVVPEPWDLTLHQLNLRYATLSCWARQATGGDGIVTVRHAVASGGWVHLDDGTVQPVLWYAPECLDAVVVDAPAGRQLTALPVQVAASGDTVDVMGKGGAQGRTVKDVGQTFGTVTAAVPHLFLLDQALQQGDSGSLVRLANGGDALGLYIGELNTPGGFRGLCQGLSQLDVLFMRLGKSPGFYEE